MCPGFGIRFEKSDIYTMLDACTSDLFSAFPFRIWFCPGNPRLFNNRISCSVFLFCDSFIHILPLRMFRSSNVINFRRFHLGTCFVQVGIGIRIIVLTSFRFFFVIRLFMFYLNMVLVLFIPNVIVNNFKCIW